MTLEQKLTDTLEAYLLTSGLISGLGAVMTPFSDSKISLPAIFIKVAKGSELIPNTGIFECSVDIELRYLVGRSRNSAMIPIWSEANRLLTSQPFNDMPITLNSIGNDIFIHSYELGESEPTARDGERHFTLTLEIGCANV